MYTSKLHRKKERKNNDKTTLSLHKDISVLVVVKKKKDIYVLASQTIPKLTRRSIESIPYLNVACIFAHQIWI